MREQNDKLVYKEAKAMTKLYKKKHRCGLCGNVNDYIVVGSTSTFWSPDLDTRPSQLKRSTIIAWVKRCPECGYCASDITNAPFQARSVVHSSQYAQQLSEESNPELANSFLCKALIDQAVGNYATASWACIHAAWACDDAKKVKPARKCRSKALDMINKCITAGYSVSEEDGEEIAIQVDLLRRASHIEEAKNFITDKRNAITNGKMIQILDFQYYLLTKSDESCHTIAEAINGN
jgi:hypothetical protein